MYCHEIRVKLTPKSSKNEIQGWIKDETGEKILKVCVTAIPEKGKANKALIKLLSKAWKVPKCAITIISGETSRLKLLKVERETVESLPLKVL